MIRAGVEVWNMQDGYNVSQLWLEHYNIIVSRDNVNIV